MSYFKFDYEFKFESEFKFDYEFKFECEFKFDSEYIGFKREWSQLLKEFEREPFWCTPPVNESINYIIRESGLSKNASKKNIRNFLDRECDDQPKVFYQWFTARDPMNTVNKVLKRKGLTQFDIINAYNLCAPDNDENDPVFEGVITRKALVYAMKNTICFLCGYINCTDWTGWNICTDCHLYRMCWYHHPAVHIFYRNYIYHHPTSCFDFNIPAENDWRTKNNMRCPSCANELSIKYDYPIEEAVFHSTRKKSKSKSHKSSKSKAHKSSKSKSRRTSKSRKTSKSKQYYQDDIDDESDEYDVEDDAEKDGDHSLDTADDDDETETDDEPKQKKATKKRSKKTKKKENDIIGSSEDYENEENEDTSAVKNVIKKSTKQNKESRKKKLSKKKKSTNKKKSTKKKKLKSNKNNLYSDNDDDDDESSDSQQY